VRKIYNYDVGTQYINKNAFLYQRNILYELFYIIGGLINIYDYHKAQKQNTSIGTVGKEYGPDTNQ
jgi:hypothetical protein